MPETTLLAFALSLLLAGPALAASATSDIARTEIERLLSRLAAKEANAHLRKKYDYIDGKGQLQTAEDFIRLVGSESSLSGNTYQIRCAGAPAVPSSEWLNLQLAEIRQAARSTTGQAP